MAFQVYRADGSCLLVNEAFRSLFGSEPPAEYNVLNDDVLEKQGFLQLIRRAFAGETVHVPAHWYDPRDLRQLDVREGRRVGIEVTLFPLRDARAQPEHIALCFKDVTAELELKLAATALELTEQRFHATFEQAAVGVARVSTEGRWLDVNQRLCEIVGYSREEMLTLTFQQLTYPPDLRIDLEFVQKALAGTLDSYSLEKRYVRRDGTLFWIDLSVSLVREQSGAPAYFIAVLQDISARKKVDEELASITRSLQAEVAERKRVEEALRESEESLATTLYSIADAVIATDTTGRVLRMNPAAEALTGFRLAEAHGQNLADVFHVLEEGTGLAADSPVDRVLRDGAAVTLADQTVLVARDGTARAIADHAAPIRDAQGRIRGVVLVFRDQTAARASERLLAESEARKAAILEAALDCIVAMDQHGLITEFNPAAERTFGFARAQVLGKPLVELIIPPAQRQQHQAGMQRYLSSGIGPILGKRVELQAMRADGSEFPVELAVVPTGSGRPMFTSYIRDITERRQAAAALRASQDRLRHLDESGIIGVIVTDSRGNIQEANQAFLEIVGFTREELLDRESGLREMTPPEWWPNDEAALQHFKRTGILAAREKEYLRKDGTRAPVLVGAAMLDEHRCVAFVLNLTDKKRAEDQGARALKAAESESAQRERAEEALRDIEEQLRQSQKLEAIGTLAGGIAHDFNNLLSVILSYSDLMLRELNPADPMHADLEQIARAGKAAGDLTHQLLAFSRRQLLQPKLLNLNDAISGINRMLRRLIGEDIELSFLPGPKLGTVFVDPSQIEQVLLNLVVNARDAMPRGGKLTVATSNLEIDPTYAAEHLDVKPGKYVIVSVSDTGAGMDRATQSRIFEPFFTTKDTGKGTGLGLSTVFGIVRQSGGSIWVYSEVGRGTTFKIYLPRAQGDSQQSEPAPPPSATLRGSETVLLVEDEVEVRNVACAILRRYGYHVLEALSGGDALLICEQYAGTIHLLLTDVVMPRMSGRELAQRLTPLRPAMKVLFMSGYTDDAIVHHGVLSSEVSFIQKPLTPQRLLGKLREVLGAQK